MSQQTPSNGPPKKLTPLNNLIFASRWLQLPLYLGLIAAQAVYVFHFWVELVDLIGAVLGNEAALFMASGTQSNLVAIMSHCGRGDEYIVGQMAHTYRWEGGGAAVLGSVQPQPLAHQADDRRRQGRRSDPARPAPRRLARRPHPGARRRCRDRRRGA